MIVSLVWNGTSVRPGTGGGTAARRDDDLLSGDGLAGAGVERAVADEARVALEERGVRVRLGAPVPSGDRDRVDPPEDPVPDLGPAGALEPGVDAEPVAVRGGVRDVRGIDEHLGRDAADVQAGAAERALLQDRDGPVGEPLVDDRVARAGADHREVEVGHLLILPSVTRLTPVVPLRRHGGAHGRVVSGEEDNGQEGAVPQLRER
jgi:hypothetical protein